MKKIFQMKRWKRNTLVAVVTTAILVITTCFANYILALADTVQQYNDAMALAIELDARDNVIMPSQVKPMEVVKKPVQSSPEREEAIRVLAKTVYGEAQGVTSDTEKAAVAWCICNRAKKGSYSSVVTQATKPNQFDGYRASNPVTDKLYKICSQVLDAWYSGDDSVRVLPPDYKWFMGDGSKNYFVNHYHNGSINYCKENAYKF